MSGSRLVPALALVPFGYFAATRLKSLRDIVYLIATSWIPAIWLIVRLDEIGPAKATTAFLAGYLAFIAIYEIGYLANDLWDAQRSDNGRTRFELGARPPYVIAFVAVRLACWAAVGTATGWIANAVWLGGFAALLVALAQHNLTSSNALRLASFLELATLRFLLPILAVIPANYLWIAIVVALIPYAYPRFLAYMDSKAILQLKERQFVGFGFAQLAWLAPLMLYLAYATSAVVLAELYIYFVIIYGVGSVGLLGTRTS